MKGSGPSRAPARAEGEEVVLWRAARGSIPDLEQFYEDHVDGLYAFVFYRVGRDPALAEDVVQETFARALDAIDQYDPARGSLGSWLCQLSRNVIRAQLRAHRRAEELSRVWEQVDESLAQIFAALDREVLSDEVIDREETRDLVNMTIANLPERYRSALTSKYVEGESLSDLADRLEVSEDAAKSLLARARRAFRETFAALGENLAEVPS